MAKYLKELPLEITRNNIVIAYVVDKPVVVNNEKDSKPSKASVYKTELCKHGFMLGLCKFGCK